MSCSSASSISLPISPTKAVAASLARFSAILARAARWSARRGRRRAGRICDSLRGRRHCRSHGTLFARRLGWLRNQYALRAGTRARRKLAAAAGLDDRRASRARDSQTGDRRRCSRTREVSLGSGRVFGINELLDQTGATLGPLVVAFAVARGGYHDGLWRSYRSGAGDAGSSSASQRQRENSYFVTKPSRRVAAAEPAGARFARAFRRYAIGGALVAAGYVDFALIAFRFQRDHIATAAAISVWFAVAMAVGAIAAPILGRLFDRIGRPVRDSQSALTSAATPLAFLGTGAAPMPAPRFGALESPCKMRSCSPRRERAGAAPARDELRILRPHLWFGVVYRQRHCRFLLDRSVVGLVIFSSRFSFRNPVLLERCRPLR